VRDLRTGLQHLAGPLLALRSDTQYHGSRIFFTAKAFNQAFRLNQPHRTGPDRTGPDRKQAAPMNTETLRYKKQFKTIPGKRID
jgi:hypothetical protein